MIRVRKEMITKAREKKNRPLVQLSRSCEHFYSADEVDRPKTCTSREMSSFPFGVIHNDMKQTILPSEIEHLILIKWMPGNRINETARTHTHTYTSQKKEKNGRTNVANLFTN